VFAFDSTTTTTITTTMGRSQTEQQQQQVGGGVNHRNVLLLKVGGSSITGKFLKMKKILIERIWIVVQYSPYIHPLDFCVCVLLIMFILFVVVVTTTNPIILKCPQNVLEKAKLETLNIEALKWFSKTVKLSINDDFLSDNDNDNNDSDNKPAMIIVHGAGSFGHHTAKKYGLRGETSPPPNNGMKLKKDMITGIAKTRLRYVA
jgi:hypothetical protein